MSNTNIEKHPDFVHIGPAVMKFYDETNDWLVDLGRVTELVLRKTVDKAYQTSVYNGVLVQNKSQSVSENWELSGKFVETLDPNTGYLAFKNCGTPSVTTACALTTITDLLQVFSGRCRVLTGNQGFYGVGVLPAPTGTVVAINPPAGTLAAGAMDVYIQAVYDGGGTSNPVLISAALVVAGGESIYIAITPPASGTPDSYNIYVQEVGDLAATLYLNTSSTDVVITTPVTGGATVPADATTSLVVTSEDGLTTYVLDTDYTIETSCAGICILPDGDICDGQWINITYSYWANPKSSMSIGPSDRIPKYAHPVIMAFKNDSRVIPAAKGVEIHLWKTDFDFGFDWDLSSLNFDSGFAFTVPVLFSETDLNHGEVSVLSERFECYALKDLRALTQYSTQTSCEGAVS